MTRLAPLLTAAAFMTCFAFCFSIVFAHTGNGTVSERVYDSHYTELTRVPEKARLRRNPFDGNLDAARAGRKLFAQHCAQCHGDSAEGSRKAPSLRAQEVQEAPPGTLFWIMTNGVVRLGMPVWSKLPEAQRWQIVTYIKSLGEPKAPDSPRVAGHPELVH